MNIFQRLAQNTPANKIPWWKSGLVYQIYPRSFCDSNGDGIGDIPGIISKLDYLAKLGVSIIWLSPVYSSPNDDNGYDISDYRNIHPDFGSIKDMKQLIAQAAKRKIKIIMDLVVNHTSDEHEWFRQSKSGKDNPYRDYYIWRDGKNGGTKPPNNWTSFFTGSAWQKDETSGQYYLHLFSKKQPDLNWKNPKIIDEVRGILKFWLDMGIAGFRCDVINIIYKTSLSDGKKRFALTGKEHYLSQEGCHSILRNLHQEVFSKYDCFTVGETVMVNPAMANDLCNPNRGELDMVFSFEHMDVDSINNKWFKTRFKPEKLFTVLEKWQSELDWNANYLENHDQPRSVSRYAKTETKEERERFAKLLAAMLCSLRGTPFIYQGQELAMTNADFSRLEQYKDIETYNIYRLMKKLHFPEKTAWHLIQKTSRDNARTPFQWSNRINGGFTAGTPWLGVNNNYTAINAEDALSRPDSVFYFYQKLIKLRQNTPALLQGSFKRINAPKNVFIYQRFVPEQICLILLNFSAKPVDLPQEMIGSILCTNWEEKRPKIGSENAIGITRLFAHEALILQQS